MSRDNSSGTYIRLVESHEGNYHVAIKKNQESAVYTALQLLANAIKRDSFNLAAFLTRCQNTARANNQPDWAMEIGHTIMIEIIAIFGGMDFLDGKILMEKGVVARGPRYEKMAPFVKDTIEGDVIIVKEEDLG